MAASACGPRGATACRHTQSQGWRRVRRVCGRRGRQSRLHCQRRRTRCGRRAVSAGRAGRRAGRTRRARGAGARPARRRDRQRLVRRSERQPARGRRHGHERQDVVHAMARCRADGVAPAVRGDRHARQRDARPARADRLHDARRAATAAQPRAVARRRCEGGGDGSVVARVASGPRERHGLRYRGIYEPYARSPRLSQHVRCVRSREGEAVRVARPARGGDQSRRRSRPAPAREAGRPRAHDRVRDRRRGGTRRRSRAGRARRACDRHRHRIPPAFVVGRRGRRGRHARHLQRQQPACRTRLAARGRCAVRRGARRDRAARVGQRPDAAARRPAAERRTARRDRLRAHARRARKDARRVAPDRHGARWPARLHVRLRRRSRRNEAPADGRDRGAARRRDRRHE